MPGEIQIDVTRAGGEPNPNIVETRIEYHRLLRPAQAVVPDELPAIDLETRFIPRFEAKTVAASHWDADLSEPLH